MENGATSAVRVTAGPPWMEWLWWSESVLVALVASCYFALLLRCARTLAATPYSDPRMLWVLACPMALCTLGFCYALGLAWTAWHWRDRVAPEDTRSTFYPRVGEAVTVIWSEVSGVALNEWLGMLRIWSTTRGRIVTLGPFAGAGVLLEVAKRLKPQTLSVEKPPHLPAVFPESWARSGLKLFAIALLVAWWAAAPSGLSMLSTGRATDVLAAALAPAGALLLLLLLFPAWVKVDEEGVLERTGPDSRRYQWNQITGIYLLDRHVILDVMDTRRPQRKVVIIGPCRVREGRMALYDLMMSIMESRAGGPQ